MIKLCKIFRKFVCFKAIQKKSCKYSLQFSGREEKCDVHKPCSEKKKKICKICLHFSGREYKVKDVRPKKKRCNFGLHFSGRECNYVNGPREEDRNVQADKYEEVGERVERRKMIKVESKPKQEPNKIENFKKEKFSSRGPT